MKEERNEGQKPKGWFSRKHQTDAENQAATEAYQAEHGREARQRKAKEREDIRETRNHWEQLALLDKRLGPGVGAEKERARLQSIIKGIQS